MSAPLGVLWQVPELPCSLLARPAEMSALVEALCGAGGGATVGIVDEHGERGVGVGKTVLAAAVARDEAVRERFVDGVYWLTLGESPDLVGLQTALAGALGFDNIALDDPDRGKHMLAGYMADKRVLLVLDDVRDAEHASAFALTGFLPVFHLTEHGGGAEFAGHAGALLLTTRDRSVLTSLHALEHPLDIPAMDDALAWLAACAGCQVSTLPGDAAAVAEACGRLPLTLAMIGGVVREGRGWGRVRGLLAPANLEQMARDFPDCRSPSALVALEASVDALADDVRARYFDLAICPEEQAFPEDALCVLWRAGRKTVRAYVDELAVRSLVQREESGAVRLHEVQRMYVRRRADAGHGLAGRHGAFIDAFARRCERGLARGPTVDGCTPDERAYFFARLPYHMMEAGRVDEVRALVWSYAWLDGKLRAVGVAELIADFERLVCARPLDRAALFMRDALRLSSDLLAWLPEQLPSQLCGRLCEHARDCAWFEPEIRMLHECLRAEVEHPWMCPSTPALTPPGGSLVYTFEGHTGWVEAVALSGDGRRALSGSRDKTVRLWDAHTGRLLRTFEGLSSGILAVALNHDGTRALTGSHDGTVAFWDTRSGALLGTFDGHAARVTAVALSGDGRRGLSGSRDKTVKLWDTQSGAVSCTFEGHSDAISAVALSGDGTRALSGSWDQTVKLWDTQSGAVSCTFEGHSDAISAVALSGDGWRALSSSSDNTIRLWDTRSGALVRTFSSRHSSRTTAVALSRDGSRVLSGSDNGTVGLWDARRGALLCTYEAHAHRVSAVALNEDGTWALTGSWDKTVKLWDTQREAPLRTLGHDRAWMATAALSGDGTRALVRSGERVLDVWDVQCGTLVRTFEGHTGWVSAVALSGDGRRALTGTGTGTLELWDTHNGARLGTFQGHADRIRAMALSGDGRRALSGSGNTMVKLWDTQRGTLLATLVSEVARVSAVALSRDGTHALLVSFYFTLELWDTQRGARVRTFDSPSSPIECVALSEDGRYALTGSHDHTVTLWDTQTGRALSSFAVDEPILAVALSSGTQRMAYVGRDSGRVDYLSFLSGSR